VGALSSLGYIVTAVHILISYEKHGIIVFMSGGIQYHIIFPTVWSMECTRGGPRGEKHRLRVKSSHDSLTHSLMTDSLTCLPACSLRVCFCSNYFPHYYLSTSEVSLYKSTAAYISRGVLESEHSRKFAMWYPSSNLGAERIKYFLIHTNSMIATVPK
jgi:hypothetical protein